MSSVEQELWNIFTFYTLHGNPLDPEHLRSTQFLKLCRDCQLFGTTALSEADVYVAYTAEVKRKNRPGVKVMTYNDFLTALMKLSYKVYPDSASIDDSFQRLLMENILPLASRRCPDSVDVFMKDPEVVALFDMYKDAMTQIFQFYASRGDVKAIVPGDRPARRSTAGGMPAHNSMKQAMGYPEFLKFANDFSLTSSVILSTLEVGDIYLSSIRAVEDQTVRKLQYGEFTEALVRCALVAYSKISDASLIDKIRGLFLYMWRSINKGMSRALDHTRSSSTYHGDLMSGAMLFNKRFTAQWAADGYRDYLSADAATAETGRQVLGRILLRRSEDTSTPLERLNKLAIANAAATSVSAAGDPTRSVTEGSVHGLSSDARSLLGLRALDGVGQGLDAASQSAPGSGARSLYEDDESLAGRSLPSSYAPSGPLYGRMTVRGK